MLPSSGLFQEIICPFYENRACERPYCHFRHVRKDSASKPTKENENVIEIIEIDCNSESGTNSKVTYNPTPISELQKIQNTSETDVDGVAIPRRHIPVPYTPLRPTTIIKPITAEVNKQVYLPGSKQDVIHDQYKPPGYSPSKESYLPGSVKEPECYTPVNNAHSLNLNYVPTDGKDGATKKAKRLEYEPKPLKKGKVNSAKYEPTPLTVICPRFSSDEEEEDVISKKQRLSPDLNDDFDNLDNEFEMLGQILDDSQAKIETTKVELSKESQSKEKVEKSNNKDKHAYSKSRHKDKRSSKETKERSSKDKDSKHDKDTKHDKHRESKSRDRSSHKSSKSKSDKSSSSSKHSDNSKIDKHKENRDSKNHRDKKKDSKESSKSRHDKKKEKDVDNEIPSEPLALMDSEEFVEEISEDDEDTIAMECMKIFEEYIPTPVSNVQQNEAIEPIEKIQEGSVTYIPTKKRISHSTVTTTAPKIVAKKDYKRNAAITLAERIAKTKQQQAINHLANPQPNIILSQPNMPTGKVRIAHVPYASSLFNAKKQIISETNTKPSTSSTTVQSVAKGATRKAHVPSEVFADRPGVLEPLASKISVNLRSLYLNKMIDECIKIYLEPIDAYARAQHEELTTSKKCNTNQIYKNSAMLAISRLRKELQECNGIKKTASECSTLNKVSHYEVLLGKAGMTASWSIERRNKMENVTHEFIGETFYNNIAKWILNEEQLRENGFPRPHPNGERGRAQIYVIDKRKMQPPEGSKRVCCRCKKSYLVTKTGFPKVLEDCIYHPNNKYKYRGDVKYQCCNQDSSSDGCTIAPTHVFEYVDYENLRGFVTTMPRDCPNGDYGVYALDCEMCYTTHGLDLTRITVINSRCKVEYETLIKPLHPIIDYNTRYSGITEEQMTDVKTTLIEVQATLLHMFNDKTILIGHSLESDFKALKIIHDTVIDTSVLFPHKMGPPYKRALRNLSSEYLRKIIQNSVEGHDSAEDAMVCMELIILKLKEELKLR